MRLPGVAGGSGFCTHRTQQEGGQVGACPIVLLESRFTPGARFLDSRDRGRGGVLAARRAVAAFAAALAALVVAMARLAAMMLAVRFATLAFAGLGLSRRRRLTHPGDGLADQLLDRGDRLLVGRRHHRDG